MRFKQQSTFRRGHSNEVTPRRRRIDRLMLDVEACARRFLLGSCHLEHRVVDDDYH
jgi:hypothetical protein